MGPPGTPAFSSDDEFDLANLPGSSSEPVHPPGTSTPQSQAQGSQPTSTKKEWRLGNAQMRILDFSKARNADHMNVKMEFTLRGGNKKIVDMPYTSEARKNCKNHLIGKCGQYLWLKDLPTDKQDKHFPDFIDQELKIWDDNNNQVDRTDIKKILEITEPSIHKIEDKFYWIAGSEEVFLLYHQRTTESGYAKKLAKEEIADMPVDIVYVGQSDVTFVNDEETAFTNLVSIIQKMNMMQDEQFVSFPLASFVAHLSAFLYKILRPQYKGFSTTVTLSGSGNTHSTGKSLMTSINQLIFYGDWPKQMSEITRATVFGELQAGRNIYLREWSKSTTEILNQAIKMVWEQLGRQVRDKYQDVNAVVLIDANMSPADIRLDHANESKVMFLATGSKPLHHRNKLKLCQEMEDLARSLYFNLPTIISIGLNCMLQRVTDDQTVIYDGMLRTDRDERQAQGFLNYDRVHTALDEAIEEYGLEKPKLFNKIPIDRTSLTYYNNREDAPSTEDMADEVATYIVEESLAENVEYSAKTKSFKLKINVTDAPEGIAAALGKCTKATSTVFGGQLGVRVRLLPSSLLSTERVSQLRSLRVAIKFADAAQKMMDEKATAQKLFASEFYKQVNRKARKLIGVHDVVEEEDVTKEGDEEEVVSDDSTNSEKFVPGKRRKVSKPEEFYCNLAGCPSAANGYKFKSAASLRKHQISVGHLKASQLSGKSKKKTRK